jgi:transcriptional regulator with XRE-family HTH domain
MDGARHEVDLKGLGGLVRRRRRELGLTQTQLGKRTGWVQERISLLESGKYGTPSLPALATIADALETTLVEVLQAAGFQGLAHEAASISVEGNGKSSSETLERGQPIMSGRADQGGVLVIRDITDRPATANGQDVPSNEGAESESKVGDTERGRGSDTTAL